jgi:hypothetical protein
VGNIISHHRGFPRDLTDSSHGPLQIGDFEKL